MFSGICYGIQRSPQNFRPLKRPAATCARPAHLWKEVLTKTARPEPNDRKPC